MVRTQSRRNGFGRARRVAITLALGVTAAVLSPVAAGASAPAPARADRAVGRDAQTATTPVTQATADDYTEVVDAVDNEFLPQELKVEPGTTVMWTNSGRSPHNIVPAVKTQDFGAPFGVKTTQFAPGDSYEFTFDTPGRYRYYCTLHGTANSGMFGSVIVGDAGAASDGTTTAKPTRSGTIRVPADFPSIQAAVDAAKPGAMVLVAPGTYHEGVTVTPGHENITIRGESRAGTILDGQFSDEAGMENGIKILADGVAVENLTAQNYAVNGFYWSGVDGYRGSYLTALRNGDYGIYSFDAVNGQLDHSYGAGSPDAGFYIGQCTKCNALIVDSESANNGLGYSGTNAGGNLVIARSSWHDNRGGIIPNSCTCEDDPPQSGVTVVGNVVYSNNNPNAPATGLSTIAYGDGILLFGGQDDVVTRNRVYDHDVSGIAVTPAPEKLLDAENPNAENFDATNNSVTDNVIEDSKYDLFLASTLDSDTEAGGNCFSGNTFTSSIPADIERLVPCGKPASSAFASDLGAFAAEALAERPAPPDYKTAAWTAPTDLPEMPRAKTAKARPATHEPSIRIVVKKVQTPPAP